MLTVNPASKLNAEEFVDAVKHSTCISEDIRKLFYAPGKFQLAISEKPIRGEPHWFRDWRDAAVNACKRDEWELTTGLSFVPDGTEDSILIPDGITTTREKDPDGMPVPDLSVNKDIFARGQTFATDSLAKDLNGYNKKNLKYNDATVWARSSTGKKRGAIVVVNRWSIGDAATPTKMLPNDIAFALFHELFHAGRMSAAMPYHDEDPAFKSQATLMKTQMDADSCPVRQVKSKKHRH